LRERQHPRCPAEACAEPSMPAARDGEADEDRPGHALATCQERKRMRAGSHGQLIRSQRRRRARCADMGQVTRGTIAALGLALIWP
jgi:hypothetical protein